MYPHIGWIKSSISPIRPLWRCLADVILRTKLLTSLQQLKKTLIVDVGVPFVVDEEAIRGNENTTTPVVGLISKTACKNAERND